MIDLDLKSKVAHAIERDKLIEPGARVLVGLSGGADSVALLDILVSLGYNCVASHCNFHLRGDESDRDEKHARDVSRKLGIEFVKIDFDVAGRRRHTGESVEMACRSLRYEWWEQLQRQLGTDRLAVAHHRDDNIETFFLNLLRGSGITGLKGMMPKSGTTVRPMLDCTRVEIEAYCRERGLDYVIDSTNLQNDYRRNRLRNIIIPEIERQFPGASRAIAKSIDCMRGNYEFYNGAVNEKHRLYRSLPDAGVDVARIVAQEHSPRMTLFELLSPLGFNMTHVENILASVSESGRVFMGDTGMRMLLDRGVLKPIEECEIADRKVDIFDDKLFKVEIFPREAFKPVRDDWSIYLDASVLDGGPEFRVRPWREGDRLAPFGMKGTKKVSDVFSDAKIPLDKKGEVLLLTRNDVVLWIIGIRASRHFAVTASTKSFICLKATKPVVEAL